MKTYNKLFGKAVWATSAVLLMASCNDAWDDHYSVSADIPVKTIAEVIEDKVDKGEEYGRFLDVLNSTLVYDGNKQLSKTYWDLLNESQFFTVWLPSENSISDERWAEYTKDIDDPTKDHKKIGNEFIRNHIAHFKHDVSQVSNGKIVMLSNKAFKFLSDGIDGVAYKSVNTRCTNGIIHELNGELEYRQNIYEVLTGSDISWEKFGKWFAKYTKLEIDEEKSIASGINDEGKMEYVDSVFQEKSILFDKYGNITVEDSDFAVFLPTPQLFQKMYDSISAFFEYGDIEKRDSLREYQTFNAMMTDMFFNMNPKINASPTDSMVSTLFSQRERRTKAIPYHVYQNPGKTLFASCVDTINCSNGFVYLVDEWPFEDTLTFRLPVKLEAEDQLYDDKMILQNKRVISSTQSVMDISKSNSANWSITYGIKDNLKGWYNVKMVFYAQNMNPSVVSKPYIIQPTIYYRPAMNANVVWENSTTMIVNKKPITVKLPFTVCGNNTKIDTLTVGPVHFETCNYQTNSSRVEVQIECVAGNQSQKNDYSWTVGLDCIILEPTKGPAVVE